jgi:DNA-binding transcriptional ArsR family regulator
MKSVFRSSQTSWVPAQQTKHLKHLQILYSNGIVGRRREGSRVYYALADYTACLLVRQATASLAGHVEDLVAIVGVEP